VVVAGGINIDRTIMVNRLPVKGETIMGSDSFYGVGGKAANTAVACAMSAGAHSSFIGAFGDDNNTAMLEAEMARNGVNTATCYKLSGTQIPCGQAYIFLLEDGDNSIVVVPAANESWPDHFNETQVEALKSSDCVLLQREVPEEYNLRIATVAKEHGVMVVLDAGGEDSVIDPKLLKLIDIFSPNETELRRLVKHYDAEQEHDVDGQLQLLRKHGLNANAALLLKRGEKGAMFVTPSRQKVEQSAMELKEDQIVDTTGAGDCFTGSFAVEYVRQLKAKKIWAANASEDKYTEDRIEAIASALKFGCCAGGLAVQAKGAMASFPKMDEVMLKMDDF